MPQYDTESIVTNTLNNTPKVFSNTEVWIIISVLLAVIGGIFLYVNYFREDKEYKGFKKLLYDFINFKFTIIEPIFRILYLIIAIALTLSSLSLITTNFFEFITVIVFGNIIVRIIFKLLLLTQKLFKDVSEINEKTPKKEIKLKQEKKQKEDKQEKDI